MSDVLVARTADRQIGLVLTAAAVGIGAVIYLATTSASESSDLISMAQGFWGAYQVKSYVYPAGNMDPTILITGKKVDSQIVNGATLVTRWNSTITFPVVGSTFTATLPATPSSNCEDLMTDSGLAPYISSIGITGGTARVPPVDGSQASTDCGAAATQSLTVTFKPRPAS
jgi:hypothetical protein